MNKYLICLITLMILPIVYGAASTLVLETSNGDITFNTSLITGTNMSCNDIIVDSGDACNPGGAGGGDITAVNTTGKYLTGGAASGDVSLLLNETELNATTNTSIDLRVTQSFMENLGFNITTDLQTLFDTLYLGIGYTDLANFTNSPGYFNDLDNFTGNLTDGKFCTYDGTGTQINCSTDVPDTNYSGCGDGEYGDGSNQCINFNTTVQDLSLNKTEADGFYLNLSGKNADQNLNVSPYNITAGTYFGVGEELRLARISSSTFENIQQMQNLFHSSGVFNQNVTVDFIKLNTDNTFNVTGGFGTIRANINATDTIFFFDWSASNNIAIALNEVIYVGIEYNAGSPQVVTKSTNTWDMQTDFPLGSIVRDVSGVHEQREDHAIGDHANNMVQRLFDTLPFARDNRGGGLIIGTTGLNISVTSGTIWEKLNKFPISAIDTSGSDTFDRYYRNGSGGWFAQEDQSNWNNTHFDDGTGTLNALGNNKWSVEWVYLEVDGEVVNLFGQEEFNSEGEAEASSPPSSVPPRVEIHSRLIGRIIFQKDATTAAATESVFTTTFTAAGVTDHGNLAGLSDDDHTQYLLADGTRALTANWDQGALNLTNVNSWWLGITMNTANVSEMWANISQYLAGEANESTRVNNIVGFNCTGTDKVTGRYLNGTAICGADADSGGSGASKWTDQGDYLEPNTTFADNVNIDGWLNVSGGINTSGNLNMSENNITGISNINPGTKKNVTINPWFTGDILNNEFDLVVGGVAGAMKLGNAKISAGGNQSVGSAGFNGTLLILLNGTVDSDFEFVLGRMGEAIRFAIPKAGVDFATQMVRSVMVGGDDADAFNDNIVNCTAQGFNLIDCDTDVTGPDLGVKDDLEVRGTGYINETLIVGQGTTNVTIDENLITVASGTVVSTLSESQLDVTNIKTENLSEVLYVQAGNASDIQVKIDQCPTRGCTVEIPTGTYTLPSNITLRNGTTLRGQGIRNTVLNFLNTSGSAFVGTAPSRLFDIVLEDFKLDCFDNGGSGINFTNISRSVVDNVHIINCDRALILNGNSFYNTFYNSYYLGGNVGIDATNNANQNTFIGGWTNNNAEHNILLYGDIDTIKFVSLASEQSGTGSHLVINDTATNMAFLGMRFESGSASGTIFTENTTSLNQFYGNSYANVVFTNDGQNARIEQPFITNVDIAPERVQFESGGVVDISGGEITTTQAFHYIETESDATLDNLDKITSKGVGEFVILVLNNTAHKIVVRHNINNIQMWNARNFNLTHNTNMLICVQVLTGGQTQWNCMPSARTNQFAQFTSGAGAPTTTPEKVADVYIDTTNDDPYMAIGTASSTDWNLLLHSNNSIVDYNGTIRVGSGSTNVTVNGSLVSVGVGGVVSTLSETTLTTGNVTATNFTGISYGESHKSNDTIAYYGSNDEIQIYFNSTVGALRIG